MAAKCSDCRLYDRKCFGCRAANRAAARVYYGGPGRAKAAARYAAREGVRQCNRCEAPVGKSVRLCDACAPQCGQCGGRLAHCGRRYCSAQCFGLAKRTRPDTDSRTKRKRRESGVPGLSEHHRRNLLAAWIAEGRSCRYCPALVETVDHIRALAAGGTHERPNLAPACRSCNSSKGARPLAEWQAAA